MIGGGALLALALSVGSLFAACCCACGALWHCVCGADGTFVLCLWIRRQYAAKGGGLMEKVHAHVLANLDFDGQGTLLEVGCGSGALAIPCGAHLARGARNRDRQLGAGLFLQPRRLHEKC